ncbi:Na+/H+ antiporter NhaC family protein [Methylothermus subterraneus]
MSSGLSLLPALIAIPLAFLSHRVVPALMAYVFIGALILERGWLPDAFARALAIFGSVVKDLDNQLLFAFSLLIGGLIGLIQRAGGIEGFVRWAEARRLLKTPRQVAVLTFITSMALFIETNFGVLIAGLIAVPLFDRYRLSRLRLSYLLDSTCAPKCMLIPLNAWGAYVASLLADQGIAQPMPLLLASLPWVFYGWIALALAGIVAATDLKPPFRIAVSERTLGELPHFGGVIAPKDEAPKLARHLWGPIGVLVAGVLALLGLTGNAPLAIFLAVVGVLAGTLGYFGSRRILAWGEMFQALRQGIRMLLPLLGLLLCAFAVGATTKALGTGAFLAGALHGQLDPLWLPFLVFGIGCLISFASGTSWGTFAILIPIVVPLAEAFQAPTALLVGAALSGGLFGDHCSPVSDTTLLASLAAGVKPIEHVRHQLPYALLGAGLALGLYLLAGAMIL